MGACGATCGIQRTRERERDVARALAHRCWPDGPLGDPGAAGEGVDHERAADLAEALREVLPARVMVVNATADGAASVYCLATTDETSWLDRREGTGVAPLRGEDRGLRVVLSPVGLYAALQEVTLVGSDDGDGVWVEERRVAGVEDRRLQLLVKGAQGVIRRAGLTLLDAAFLAEPHGAGTLWQSLFERDPPASAVGDYAPAALSAAAPSG
jgi:hypothetical protein